MQNMRILNSKERKTYLKQLGDTFGFTADFHYVLLFREKDSKLFFIDEKFKDVNIDNLRINSLGLYVAEFKNGEVRLSIEGSQLIGPLATQQVLEIDAEQLGQFLRGEVLDIDSSLHGFVIVRSGTEYYGCGKLKEGKLLNYVPKERRIRSTS